MTEGLHWYLYVEDDGGYLFQSKEHLQRMLDTFEALGYINPMTWIFVTHEGCLHFEGVVSAFDFKK